MTDLVSDRLSRELLVSGVATLHSDGVHREILIATPTALQSDGLFREVLVYVPSRTVPNYPVLPTLNGYSTIRRPKFASLVQQNKGLREVTQYQQVLPVWEFELVYEILRDQTQNAAAVSWLQGFRDLQALSEIFVAGGGGSFGWFYFDDPSDNSRTGQLIAVGDGSSNAYRVVRTWGEGPLAVTEPVGGVNINEPIAVYVDDVLQNETDWTISDDQTSISFVNNLPLNAILTMDFSFYYLCRFLDDNLDLDQFMYSRWRLPSLRFVSVYSDFSVGL